jgi:indole-3-glycerol phosphate synthase
MAIPDKRWGESGETMKTEEQRKYVKSFAISCTSVLTACHKFQTEAENVDTNVIRWFQF